ncbi:HNH endonuclease signature motif containing protein [Microbacterium sp. NPDC055455]
MSKSTADEQQYIRDRVSIDARGCWNWNLSRKQDGYGLCWRRIPGWPDRVAPMAHRFSYMVFVGPIPEGMQLDHLCRNRGCVNPAHLEPVTALENSLRGRLARTGRPFTVYERGENLWAAAVTVSTHPRHRKVFSSTSREIAIAKAEAFIESLAADRSE